MMCPLNPDHPHSCHGIEPHRGAELQNSFSIESQSGALYASSSFEHWARPAHPFVALKRCSAAWVPLRPLYVLKQEFEPMSPKCRHVNATSTQRLPACLQEALRALLARRLRRLWRFFSTSLIDCIYFSPKFPPPNRRVRAGLVVRGGGFRLSLF